MLTAGLLTPRSTAYPALGTEWIQGLKACLKQEGQTGNIRLLTDNIGFGTDEPAIYARVEKMILEEEVDLVFLFGEPRLAEIISPLFTATGKLLVVVNLGAQFPDNWEAAPTTLHLGLQFAFLCYLTGKRASQQTEKEAINLISYYDGGYRQCFTMLHRHQTGGGIPVFNYVTPLRETDFTLAPVGDFLKAHGGVKNMLCMASGAEAKYFCRELEPLQQAFGFSVWANPMMLTAIPGWQPGDTSARISGYVPWHPGLDGEANRQFVSSLTGQGKAAGYFSLLGWECGLLLQFILQQKNAGAAASIERLKETRLESPRGWLQTDPRTHMLKGPAYFATRLNDGEVVVEGVEEAVEEDWQQFTRFSLAPGENSNWRNTYLCI